MPTLWKISDNVRSQKEEPTVNPNVFEYPIYFAFHPRRAMSGEVKRTTDNPFCGWL